MVIAGGIQKIKVSSNEEKTDIDQIVRSFSLKSEMEIDRVRLKWNPCPFNRRIHGDFHSKE